jgi:cell division protein FtsB
MSNDSETAQAVARTHSRATIVSALLGFIGVVAAAWIGSEVGRTKGQKIEAENQSAEIAERDRQITQLKQQVNSLQAHVDQLSDGKKASGIIPSTTINTDQSQSWQEPQSAEGYTVRLKSCSRRSTSVRCLFTVSADERDHRLLLWGRSRLVDSFGQDHLAAALSFGASEMRVNRYGSVYNNLVRGVPVNGTVVFEGIPGDQMNGALIELVFSALHAQFRDVPLT